MTLFMSEPPAGQPLALAETKAFLRLDTDDEDDLVGDLITAAIGHLEAETGLALITQGWRLCLDDWPRDRIVCIARGPVRQIVGVTVYDADGAPADLDLTGFVLDAHARPARLLLQAVTLPGQAINGIEIDFTAGFGDTAADVPEALRRALMLHVSHMYAFRGAVPASSQPAGVPPGYGRLIAPFCRRAL